MPLVASVLVTTTLTAPAACAGVVAVIEVALTTMMLVAAVPPKVTVAPVAKFVPVIVTFWPPARGPELSAIAVTVGAPKVKPFVLAPFVPSLFVTITLVAPAACAGVVAVIEVPLTTVTFVAGAPPKVTVAPAAKFVPVIVTFVPPSVLPVVTLRLVTVGAL